MQFVAVLVLSLLAAASVTGRDAVIQQPPSSGKTALAASVDPLSLTASASSASAPGSPPKPTRRNTDPGPAAANALSSPKPPHLHLDANQLLEQHISPRAQAEAMTRCDRGLVGCGCTIPLREGRVRPPESDCTLVEDKGVLTPGWANNPNALQAIVTKLDHQVGPGYFEPTDPLRVARCQHLAATTPPPAPAKSPIGLMSGPYPAQHELRHHFPILAAPIQKVRQGDTLVDPPAAKAEQQGVVEYVYQPRNCWDVVYEENPEHITDRSDEYITGCAPYKKHAQRLRQFIDCGNAVFAGITRWDDQRGEFKAAVAAERGKIKLEMEAHATFDDYADFSIENPASYLKRIGFSALVTKPDVWGSDEFFKDLFYLDPEKYASRLQMLADKVREVNTARLAHGKPEFHPRQPPKRMIPKVNGKEYHVRPVALFGYTHIQDTLYDYEYAYMTEAQEAAFQQCFGALGSPEAKSLQHAFFMYPTMMGAVGQLAHGLSQHDNYYITGGETAEHLRGEPKSVMPHSQYVLRLGVPSWCARKATELTSNFALSKYAANANLVFAGYSKTYGVFDWNAMCAQAHTKGYPYSSCRVFAQCWVKAIQRACAIDERCCSSPAGHDACKGNKWDSSACRQSLFHIVDEAVDEDPYPRSNVKGWLPPWARTTAADNHPQPATPRVGAARSSGVVLHDNPFSHRRGMNKRSLSLGDLYGTPAAVSPVFPGDGSAAATAASAASASAASAASASASSPRPRKVARKD